MQRPRTPGAGITGADSISLGSDVPASIPPVPFSQASARPTLRLIRGSRRHPRGTAFLSEYDRFTLVRIAQRGLLDERDANWLLAAAQAWDRLVHR